MNEAAKDGGPAFPSVLYSHERAENWSTDGMSLRDWFAGQAISICSGNMREYDLAKAFGGRNAITTEEIIAYQAYALADAMLAERSKAGPRT